MRSKLLFAFLAVTSCKQACGLAEATTGGGGAGTGGNPQQGGNVQGGAPGTGAAGGSAEESSSSGPSGGSGGALPYVCEDFQDGIDAGLGCGQVLAQVQCPPNAEEPTALRYDCVAAPSAGCAFPGDLTNNPPSGGTIDPITTTGILAFESVDSGFLAGSTPALYLHQPDVAGSFLAVTLVQPLSVAAFPQTSVWPTHGANLAGLVVRNGACTNAVCGRWTKFEVGTNPLDVPGWVFASSNDGKASGLPEVFVAGTYDTPPQCPPPALVGICGIRDGGELTTRPLLGFPTQGPGSSVVSGQATWSATGPVDIGMVTASGYGDEAGRTGVTDPGNDIRARFGIFTVYTVPDVDGGPQCNALFEQLLEEANALAN
jgi:hypothetical protein